MKLSTSTNICAFSAGRERYPMSYCIEACAKAGYQVLDVNFCECMNPHSRMRDDDWEDYVKELKRLGDTYGILFDQSHLPYYNLFVEQEEGYVKTMEELIRRSIIASAELGVKWTVTHPGTDFAAGEDLTQSKMKNLEYYSSHVETARHYGIGIALENDFEYRKEPYFQHAYCSNIHELVDLVDAFGDPEHVGACYDFGHANLVNGGQHRKNLNLLGHRLKAVHVQDNKGQTDEHLLPFHGNIDWKDAVAGLVDIDFQGNLTYEIQEWGRFYPKEMKGLVLEHSLKIGSILLGYYTDARTKKEKGEKY